MNKKIMKILPSAALAIVLIFCMAVSAFAELVPSQKNWLVTFNASDKMVSNFKTAEMDDLIYGLQPGDHTEISMDLHNDNDSTVDWYMANEVINSLEDTRDEASLSGGAYSYILTYKKNGATEGRTLYSSDTVGGEDVSPAGEGLHEATDALIKDGDDEYIFLDTYSKGEGGVLTLYVKLEGETQGNDYQDTLADLQFRFAVEKNLTKEGGEEEEIVKKRTIHKQRVVRTGDYTNTIPYLIAAAVSGIAVLILAFYSLHERRRQRGGRG